MAANALEEKINKIKQQNEEIKRRYEEVEEDKKNAAKLNALVQMVPSTDWPERKEPPEFSNPPRTNNKSKLAKEPHEHPHNYTVSGEGRKIHVFAQGEGPPPDPKYNFLADSEREESNMNSVKDDISSRGQKYTKDIYRRKFGGKDGIQRDYRMSRVPHKDEQQPQYEAWRAERNRIDEDRISRQRTAEGNWRREWDNDKAHVVDEVTRSEGKLGDYVRKDHKDFDKRYHINGNDYVNHNRGGNHRSYRGASKHFHNNYENRSNNAHHRDGHIKNPLSLGSEERTVVATEQSIKVTVNHGNRTKGPVMSVKVNSPSIAGTGRVGPRQRSRITYSSHPDVEVISPETEPCARPKSFEDKSKGIYHDNLHKSPNPRKSQKNLNVSNKSYLRKKEIREDDSDNTQKYHETDLKSSHACKEYTEQRSYEYFKPSKTEENKVMSLQNDMNVTDNQEERNVVASDEPDIKDVKLEIKNDQNENLNGSMNILEKNETYAEMEDKPVLENLDLFVPEIGIDDTIASVPSQIVQTAATSECEITKTDLTISFIKNMDENAKNEIKSVVNQLCDVNNDVKKIVENENDKKDIGNQEQNQAIKEIINHNCDSKPDENVNKQGSSVKYNTETFLEEDEANKEITPFLFDVRPVDENEILENLESEDNKALEGEKTYIIKDEIPTTDGKLNIGNKQNICINKTQKRTNDNNVEQVSSIASDAVINNIECSEEDLQLKAKVLDKVVETEK